MICICGNENFIDKKALVSINPNYSDYLDFRICTNCGLMYDNSYFNSKVIEDINEILKVKKIKNIVDQI